MAGFGFGDTGSSFVDTYTGLDCGECLFISELDGQGFLDGSGIFPVYFDDGYDSRTCCHGFPTI